MVAACKQVVLTSRFLGHTLLCPRLSQKLNTDVTQWQTQLPTTRFQFCPSYFTHSSTQATNKDIIAAYSKFYGLLLQAGYNSWSDYVLDQLLVRLTPLHAMG